MRKGSDWAMFRKTVVDNRTGETAQDVLVWLRPPHGVKDLARRHKAKRAAKQARKRNR